MVYNNVSYMVGSANAKLADDMKKYNKQRENTGSSRIDKVAQRLNSYFCRQCNEDSSSSSIDLDFQLVKISCKKEFAASVDEKSATTPVTFLQKLIHFIKFKWLFRMFAFVVVGSLVGYSLFRIVGYKYFKGGKQHDALIMNSKRNAIDYDFLSEWSSQSMPSVYELEPFTFYDSNGDSYGDLRGATLKLDYIKNVLKINCVLLRNLQHNLPQMFGSVYELDVIDDKLGTIADLKHFISVAHEKSMKAGLCFMFGNKICKLY